MTDPEERARHAALGSDEPSAAVAAALDAAARHARRRGSIDAAAELAELALSRTPAGDAGELLRRTVDAAGTCSCSATRLGRERCWPPGSTPPRRGRRGWRRCC